MSIFRSNKGFGRPRPPQNLFSGGTMHFKNRKYYFWILHIYEKVCGNVIKSLIVDVLSGFWAPGAFQNDPAYHFNPYSYGRSGYPMVFYISLKILWDISKFVFTKIVYYYYIYIYIYALIKIRRNIWKNTTRIESNINNVLKNVHANYNSRWKGKKRIWVKGKCQEKGAAAFGRNPPFLGMTLKSYTFLTFSAWIIVRVHVF